MSHATPLRAGLDKAGIERAIRSEYAEWVKDFNAHQPEKLAQHYTEHARIQYRNDVCKGLTIHSYPPAGCDPLPSVRGTDAIEDLFTGILHDRTAAILTSSVAVRSVDVSIEEPSRPHATLIAEYTITSTNRETNQTVTEKHKHLVFYAPEPKPSGPWKRFAEQFDLP